MIQLLLAAAVATAPDTAPPSCLTRDERVESVIRAKAVELKAEEYCQFRFYETLSDVDGDGHPDFLVVFALEGLGGGGNNHVQFLAVFPSGSEWRPVVAQVGARGERNVMAIDVKEHRIELEVLRYGKGDAMCCPSQKDRAVFRWREGQLTEQR